MPNYREIYDAVFRCEPRYNLAQNSPGLREVIKATNQLSGLSGRALDIGCGIGFVVEYLSGPDFRLRAFGIDVSQVAIDSACERLGAIPGIKRRLHVSESQSLPFEDGFFKLVTCFDVLEHLDGTDIDVTLVEMARVLQRGGLLMGSVSCRESGFLDLNGENLHRTVQSIDWWVDRIRPDRVDYDAHRSQLTFWKRTNSGDSRTKSQATLVKSTNNVELTTVNGDEQDSARLYQKIYDEHQWYGDADCDRCPGVRLLPKYQEWLLSPVMDLGCGRGQTVERLRELGLEADGIDQIKSHPGMRVGDITKPVPQMEKYRSALCVDCIEHLHEEQVIGLFGNMKRVERQAFSIHNGESTETGQELHVNRRSFVEWGVLIREHFDIAAAIKIHDQQMLYLTTTKKGDRRI